MASHQATAFRGTFFHTPAYGQLEVLRDHVVVVQAGKIVRMAEASMEASVLREFGLAEARRLKVPDC